MPVLAAAVTAVGLLGLTNLVLTFGVVRRLREHSALLSARSGSSAPWPAVGTRVRDFTATTVDQGTVTAEHLSGRTLVGFFSPGCAPCDELRPEFVRYASALDGVDVLAVVNLREAPAPDGAVSSAVAELASVARVIVEGPDETGITGAFGVHTYPVLCTVEDGRITASGVHLSALREPVRA